MSDIAKLGIGFETAQATANAKAFDRSLSGITGTTAGMTKAMIASQLALDAVKSAARFVTDEFSKAVRLGITFEKTMSDVKAVSGATSKQMEELTKAARKMGAETAFSASQAAEGLVFLSQAGLKAEQSAVALPQVLNLASAGNLSLAESADIATNAMSGMRLTVDDLGRITDVFAVTAANSNTNVQQMGEAFTYAASVAASAGVSVEQLSSLIGILGNAGIQGSMAGTQLAAGISKAAEEGKELIPWLKELEAQGASTAEVMEIFGERASRGVLAIIGQGTKTLDAFIEKTKGAAGAAELMGKVRMDNLNGDLLALDSAIDDVRIGIFEAFSPDLRAIVQSITKAVRDNADSFQQAITPIAEMAKTLTAVATSANTVTSNLENLAIVATEKLENAFWMQSKAMSAFAAAAFLLTGKTREAKAAWDDFTGATDTKKDLLDALTNKIKKQADEIRNNTTATGESTDKTKQNTDAKAASIDPIEKRIDAIRRENEQLKINRDLLSRGIEIMRDDLRWIKEMEEAADKAATEADWLTLYIQEQESALKNLGIKVDEISSPMNDLADTQEKIKTATDGTTASLDKQAKTLTTITNQATRAAEAVGKFSGSSLAGQTFTVTRGVADTAGASMGSMTSATSATSAPSMAGILKRAEALQYAFLAEDQLLSEMRQKLIKTADDYGKISKDSLEEQLDNLEEQQRLIKQIETIENRQNTEKLSNLDKQDALLTQFSEEAAKLAMEGLIPKDLLDATKAQYADLQAKVNEIDFSNISDTDTALLTKFRESAEAYLDSAASVWKSSEQYQVIKDEIESQFTAIATSIKTQMAPATFAAASAANAIGGVGLAMTAIKQNEPGATAALTDIAAGASTLNQAAGGLTGGLSQAAAAAGQTADNAVMLKSDLTAATKPFDNMTVSLQTFADQIKVMATQISQSAAGEVPAGGGAIPTGGGTSTGGTTVATFQKYISSYGALYRQMSDGQILPEMQPYLGKGVIHAISEDGQKAVWDTQQTSIGSVRYYAFRSGESTPAKAVYVPSSGFAIAPGFDSFQRGSWNINGTTPAMLHDGEMVIRRDDAPLVRSLLRESGDSGKYGATPMVGNSAKSESMMEQMIMLLSEIAGSIGILGNRPVNVDVRRVSDALDRFQRTRGAA